jgi:hypothetical protein
MIPQDGAVHRSPHLTLPAVSPLRESGSPRQALEDWPSSGSRNGEGLRRRSNLGAMLACDPVTRNKSLGRISSSEGFRCCTANTQGAEHHDPGRATRCDCYKQPYQVREALSWNVLVLFTNNAPFGAGLTPSPVIASPAGGDRIENGDRDGHHSA